MKILILSDTHGNRHNMDKLIPLIIKEIDLIIHAGDNFRDSIYLKDKTSKPIIAVTGNCDFEIADDELVFELEGLNFMLVHGHRHRVKYNLDLLAKAAYEKGANIVIFGHTHIKEDKIVGGIEIINPGSLSLPRDDNRGSYVIMDIKNGKYTYSYHYN
nr:metallophosphoesterase [uncultured Peptostreptococcus sp.]